MQDFDLSVIGAGPAGYVGAIRAAQLGARVSLVEKAELGGVCLNRGCIPTKTLTNLVELLEKIRASEQFGIRFEGRVSADLKAAVRRKREVVATMVKGIRGLLTRRGVTLISGEARFVGEKTIELNQPQGVQRISAKAILIATGSEPAELPALSFDGSRIISSDEALEIEEIPESILVVGAGYIGCEFASIFSGLGSAVTMVEMLERVLPNEDHDISIIIERELRKRKVNVITGDSVASCTRSDSGVKCVLKGGRQIEVTKVLVSVGRRLNTTGLSLERIGVECGTKGEIRVNDAMETSVAGIYAAGDAVGKKMLAHCASKEALVAVENALGGKKVMDYSAVPACVFTRPEVGTVGMTEKQAVEKGLEVKVAIFNFRALGKAHVLGETSGMVKIVADARSDVVLGVHIVGPHASELVHEGAIAVAHQLTARALGETIHAHPTLSEAVMEAAQGVHGISVHSPE